MNKKYKKCFECKKNFVLKKQILDLQKTTGLCFDCQADFIIKKKNAKVI